MGGKWRGATCDMRSTRHLLGCGTKGWGQLTGLTQSGCSPDGSLSVQGRPGARAFQVKLQDKGEGSTYFSVPYLMCPDCGSKPTCRPRSNKASTKWKELRNQQRWGMGQDEGASESMTPRSSPRPRLQCKDSPETPPYVPTHAGIVPRTHSGRLPSI